MAFVTLSGINIKVPTRGTQNWDAVILSDNFQKLASHQHTAGGDGNQLITASYSDNSVDDTKIRLRNNQFLRGRNAANTADIDILRVTSLDTIELTGLATSSAGTVTVDEAGAVVAVVSGETLTYPNLIVNALLTFNIPSGASFCGLKKLTVNGTFNVQGEATIL